MLGRKGHRFMFRRNKETKQLEITRGDIGTIRTTAKIDGTDYTFKVGDVVRLSVFKRKDCHCVELIKDVIVDKEGQYVDICLTSNDTKIGDIISRDVDYWYEIVLNPDTAPQTIIGYEIHPETGKPWPKIFKLLPEAKDEGGDN